MRNSQQSKLKSHLALSYFLLASCWLPIALLATPPLNGEPQRVHSRADQANRYYRAENSPPGPPSQSPANPKVNLVSIVTDDQALWSIGAYGNRESITPNMDRLALEGVKFNNAFVTTPVCSPSRAAFLTGLYGSQVGITDYLTPDEGAAGMGLPASAT